MNYQVHQVIQRGPGDRDSCAPQDQGEEPGQRQTTHQGPFAGTARKHPLVILTSLIGSAGAGRKAP